MTTGGITQLAHKYLTLDIKSRVDLKVLQFVRRDRYSGLNWAFTAGSIDYDFVNYVKKMSPDLLSFFNANGEGATLVDSSGQNVDFLHLSATLNALILPGQAQGLAEWAGWAGDLQSMIGDLQSQANGSDDFDTLLSLSTNIIGSSDSHFSTGDMLADIDAYNISKIIQNNSKSVYQAIEDYYSRNYKNRFTNFINNYGGFDNLKERVEFNLSNIFGIEPPLIKQYKIKDVTPNEYKALQQAFLNFINSKVNLEAKNY